MSDLSTDPREATGAAFSMDRMRHAREQSWQAVRAIAAGIRPGMTEQQGTDHALQVLAQPGMERHWHPVKVRFGESTLATFRQISDPTRVLREDDIFFVDIGPVWQGHEGDAGDSFTMGNDAEMAACAAAARQLWHEVAERWRQDRTSGQALYAWATERATAMGWRLNLDTRGHRVCDFPHAIYEAGKLADFALCPQAGLWVLEIQIAHPTRPFGAFFEDLLFEEALSADA